MVKPKSFAVDELLCECSGTTCAKIKSLCEQGMVDLETISRKTGAMAGCGSCEWDIKDFIAQYLNNL